MPTDIPVPDFSGISRYILTLIAKPYAGFWWLGPTLVTFAWGVVPWMRYRNPVLGVQNYSTQARLWWSPGLGFFGLTGIGLSMVSAPLLIKPLAEQWQPFGWPGISLDLSPGAAAVLVCLGVLTAFKGLELYAHAWHRDRVMRWHAWRWRQGAGDPVGPREPGPDGRDDRS